MHADAGTIADNSPLTFLREKLNPENPLPRETKPRTFPPDILPKKIPEHFHVKNLNPKWQLNATANWLLVEYNHQVI